MQLFSGLFVDWASTDDVIPGLEGRGVDVLAGTEEEGGGFVAVLPNRLFEVFPCGRVVSAHLS